MDRQVPNIPAGSNQRICEDIGHMEAKHVFVNL